MSSENIRLDKWLWAARFYKTRTLAKEAVEGGKVKINGKKTKPGKNPAIGDTVELRQGWDVKTVIIDNLADKRRSASEAQTLYHETSESQEKRQQTSDARKAGLMQITSTRRPDKKQRRDIQKLKEQFQDK